MGKTFRYNRICTTRAVALKKDSATKLPDGLIIDRQGHFCKKGSRYEAYGCSWCSNQREYNRKLRQDALRVPPTGAPALA